MTQVEPNKIAKDLIPYSDNAMTEPEVKMGKGLLKYFVIPIIVGLIIAVFSAIFSIVIPKFMQKDYELSYSIDGPITYLDQETVGNAEVKVNDVPITQLYAYKVRLWNSGELSLKNLPVRFVFNGSESDFEIFSVSHKTNPAFEFGEITEEGSDFYSKRFVYELINKKDEDIVSFLTNKGYPLEIYAKSEGLEVQPIRTEIDDSTDLQRVAIFASVIGALGAMSAIILQPMLEKSIQELFRISIQELFRIRKRG